MSEYDVKIDIGQRVISGYERDMKAYELLSTVKDLCGKSVSAEFRDILLGDDNEW